MDDSAVIHSRDNARYKLLQRIARNRVDKRCLLEGVHVCQEWLRHSGQPELAVFDVEQLSQQAELQALDQLILPQRRLFLAPALFRRLSHLEGDQGVCFVIKPTQPLLPEKITHSCVWLDRVQDPGNVGSILRSSAAAGIRHVYLSLGCARVWTPKVLRSAQGAHFALQLYEGQNLQQLLPRLAVPLLVSSLEQAVSLYEQALPPEAVWLFAHEGQGASADLLQAAQLRVRIPQDNAVESLNVAAAAAVCLFEHKRQQLRAS